MREDDGRRRLERRPGRRPELDGLRGIAILLVVLDHGEVEIFRGAGGVGVTLFLVLSGYLISGLLIEEQTRTQRLDLRGFYARRVRRLLPALVLLLVVTLLRWGWQALPTAVATLLYVANIPASHEGSTLFGPLHHMWSLAVEEQFYLLWPAFLLLLLPRVGSRRRLVIALAVFTTIALVVRVVGYEERGYLWAYHATLPNVFPLMAGALLAAVPGRLPGRLPRRVPGRAPGRVPAGMATLLTGLVGVALLVGLSIASVPGSEDWMVARTVLTVPVAVLLIAAVPAGLGLAPLRYLGRVSYGWYLWHVFFQFELGGLLGSVVSLLVAVLSFHLLEQRFTRPAPVRDDHVHRAAPAAVSVS